MKTLISMAVVAAMALTAVPAYALEAVGVPAVKTLTDFQREYSGTKPMVAFEKYREFKYLQKFPRPTLDTSRIRTEVVEPSPYLTGTKPFIKALYPTTSLGRLILGPVSDSGTKPIVAMMRRAK